MKVLAVKIARSKQELDGQAICMALYGLQNMCSAVEAVQEVLTALASVFCSFAYRGFEHIRQQKGSFSSQCHDKSSRVRR